MLVLNGKNRNIQQIQCKFLTLSFNYFIHFEILHIKTPKITNQVDKLSITTGNYQNKVIIGTTDFKATPNDHLVLLFDCSKVIE